MRSILVLIAALNVGDEPPYVGRWAANGHRCEDPSRVMVIRRDQFYLWGEPGTGCVFEHVQPRNDDAFDVVGRCRSRGTAGQPEVIQQFTFRMDDEELTVERQGKPPTPPMTRCDDE